MREFIRDIKTFGVGQGLVYFKDVKGEVESLGIKVPKEREGLYSALTSILLGPLDGPIGAAFAQRFLPNGN